MILFALCGFGLLVLLAIAVSIIDTTQEAGRRELAAERRKHWEEIQRAARNEQD